MNILKQIWNTFITNFGTIISLLGLVATLYFGIYHIPEFVTEYKTLKKNTAINEVIQTSKELIYSDSLTHYTEIKHLIESKESRYGENFNKNPKWFLLRIEESFLEDKFLALSKRRELTKEIDEIIKQIPDEDLKIVTKKSDEENAWIYFITVPITLIIFGLGIYSIILRFKSNRKKEEEIKNEIDQAQYEIGATTDSIEYKQEEEEIIKAVRDLGYEFRYYDKSDQVFDLDFYNNSRRYFLEIKTLRRSKVGLRSIAEFLNKLSARSGIGIFIYNTSLTQMSKQRLEEFNNSRKTSKAFAIEYNRKTIKEEIKRIVNETA